MPVGSMIKRLPRIWWWPPWRLTRWWMPAAWLGGDEWCNIPVCFTVPPLGCFLIFPRGRGRPVPCAKCWGVMDPEQQADYLPGGCMEGGR